MRNIVPCKGTKLSLGTAQVLTGTGVDLDLVADLDEQGHINLSAGLNGSGLQSVGSGVASEAGLGSGTTRSTKLGTSTPKTLPL